MLTGPHAGYALSRIMQLRDMRLCGVASHWNSLLQLGPESMQLSGLCNYPICT